MNLWPWDHNGAYLYDPYVGSFARFEQVCLNWKTFICNFVSSVKLCQGNLHKMYCCNEEKYNCNDFPQFEIFIKHAFDPLHIMWWNNLVIGVLNANFFYSGIMYNIHKTCKVTNDYIMVNQEAWVE
jgi:hypothetical protein